MTDISILGAKINKYRYLKGKSQQDLVRRPGVDKSTIFHYKNGIHTPSHRLVKKLELIVVT